MCDSISRTSTLCSWHFPRNWSLREAGASRTPTSIAQLSRPDAMGRFNKGEDAKFFADLQSFYDIAYCYIFKDAAPPIAAGASPDTDKVFAVRAFETN